jgi:hypothetical protein
MRKSPAVPKTERPYMPHYGVPESTKGTLSWKWALDRLTKSHNYYLATSSAAGPHVMPIWGIWVENTFVFSTGRESRKARNLAKNANCVVCTEKLSEAVILEGAAKEITDPAEQKRLDAPYFKKYKGWHLDPKLGPIFRVTPNKIFGLNEAGSMQSATRWRFAKS